MNQSPNPSCSDAIALYLELMKRALLNTIYDDDLDLLAAPHAPDPETGRLRPVRGADADPARKQSGEIWPSKAHTMIGMTRLNHLQFCAQDVLARKVPGDFIETGVWRGGASIFMRAVLKVFGITDRMVWAADSFEGLPPPDTAHFPQDAGSTFHQFDELAVDLATVQSNFRRYGLLDDQVIFLKGWFKDTLPTAPIDRLAILRLDGDLYESTIQGLAYLYPKLSIGGYCIVDDYGIACCRQAVTDYRQANGIDAPIQAIDAFGACWQRQV